MSFHSVNSRAVFSPKEDLMGLPSFYPASVLQRPLTFNLGMGCVLNGNTPDPVLEFGRHLGVGEEDLVAGIMGHGGTFKWGKHIVARNTNAEWHIMLRNLARFQPPQDSAQ